MCIHYLAIIRGKMDTKYTANVYTWIKSIQFQFKKRNRLQVILTRVFYP